MFCCDAVVNCLDSIPKKKMFEEAACAKAFPLCLALFLATRALPSGPSQESCAYASPGRTHGQISESRLHLVHCFHWAAMRFVVLLKSPEKGACKTSGVLQRSGKGRLGLQAEKGPFLSLSCQGKRGCEQRAHPSQFWSGGRWCRRFSCPGSAARQHASAVPFVPSSRAYAVFPGMRLSGQHSDGFEEPWVSRLPVSG